MGKIILSFREELEVEDALKDDPLGVEGKSEDLGTGNWVKFGFFKDFEE